MVHNIVFVEGRDTYQWNDSKDEVFNLLYKKQHSNKHFNFIKTDTLCLFKGLVSASNNIIYPENTLILSKPSYGQIPDMIDSLKIKGFRVDQFISTEKIIDNKLKLFSLVDDLVTTAPIFCNVKPKSKNVFQPLRRNFPFVNTNETSDIYWKDEPYVIVGEDVDYITFMEVYVLFGKVVDCCTGRFYPTKVALSRGQSVSGFKQDTPNTIYQFAVDINTYENTATDQTEAEMDKLLAEEHNILLDSEIIASELKFSSVALVWAWNPIEEDYQFINARSVNDSLCSFFHSKSEWNDRLCNAIFDVLKQDSLIWLTRSESLQE
jgi:hypothetical protein